MKTIPVDQVVVPEGRQRRAFDPVKMQELTDSIASKGLIHPIVLREDNTLVVGERRLRAIRDLAGLGLPIRHDSEEVPLGAIPYTSLTELSPLEAEEAELEENIQRVDLTWQERASATSRLRSLRIAQAVAAGVSEPSVAELAEEVRGSSKGNFQEQTRRELIVAKHLDKPEVASAANVDEAFKVLRRAEQTERSRALGESVGRTFTADLHRCINADALDWLAACPAEQFDVILTDTPYGMGAHEFGDSGRMNMAAHSYVDDDDTFQRCLDAAEAHFYRVTKPLAHLYWFCDIDKFFRSREAFARAGWWVFRTPLIWHKPNGARAPWPENGPHRKWECILYAVKGKRFTTKLASDVLSYSNEPNAVHGAQKPVALFTDLLSRSVNPGDSVLDPFCGTGPIFPAAHELKCRATGIEIDQASYGIAVQRIEDLKLQLELGI